MYGVSLKVSAGDANLNSMQALFVICISFKGALCSLRKILLSEDKLDLFVFFMPVTKQTNLKRQQFHTVLLCLNVADPATFVASNSVQGP